MPQAQIPQTNFIEQSEARHQARRVVEDGKGFLHGEAQHLVNVQTFVPNVEDGALVAGAPALFANQLHVGQKLHLHGYGTVALAGFATSAGHVEGKMAWRIAAFFGVAGSGKNAPNDIEGLHVRDGIGTGSAANRRLVNHHHVLHQFRAEHAGTGDAAHFNLFSPLTVACGS